MSTLRTCCMHVLLHAATLACSLRAELLEIPVPFACFGHLNSTVFRHYQMQCYASFVSDGGKAAMNPSIEFDIKLFICRRCSAKRPRSILQASATRHWSARTKSGKSIAADRRWKSCRRLRCLCTLEGVGAVRPHARRQPQLYGTGKAPRNMVRC